MIAGLMTAPCLSIFEGPDGAGKSTLIHETINYLQGCIDGLSPQVTCFGPPDTDPPYIGYSQALGLARRSLTVSLHDRSFLGERVYQPIFRPNSHGLDDGELLQLLLIAEAIQTRYVFVNADDDVLRERHNDRLLEQSQSAMDEEAHRHLTSVLKGWDAVEAKLRRLVPNRITNIDTTNASPPELASFIARPIIERLNDWPMQLLERVNSHVVGIGNSDAPEFAIVGDRMHDFSRAPEPNHVMWSRDPWANRTPFDSGQDGRIFRAALAYALDQLDGERTLHDLYVTYAKKDHIDAAASMVRLRQELAYVRAETILCLGDHAYERVTHVGGEFGWGLYNPKIVKLPSPGRWSRMADHRPRAVREYGDILKGHLSSE